MLLRALPFYASAISAKCTSRTLRFDGRVTSFVGAILLIFMLIRFKISEYSARFKKLFAWSVSVTRSLRH